MILLRVVSTVAAIALGLVLLLVFLWLTLALTSGVLDLAEEVGRHGPGWWAVRVIVGLVALGIGGWLWTLVASAVIGLVNGAAYLFGVGLAKLIGGRGVHRTLYAIGINGALLGKAMTGLLIGLTVFWLLVLTPLWVAVPRWTLFLGILTWLLIWMPSMVITAFASSGDQDSH
jgi:hypothetical protein